MEKKIIAYKIKEIKNCEYLSSAANTLISETLFTNSNSTINASHIFLNKLKSAGVLSLWFDPIYEEEEIKISKIPTDDEVKIMAEKSTKLESESVEFISKYYFEKGARWMRGLWLTLGDK